MLVIWIVLAFVVGFLLGHLIWTKTKIEIVEKEVIKPVVEKEIVRPDDYDKYLEWAEHKEDWINLQKLIPDVTIQDDDKFDKIMAAINKVLSTTESGDITPAKYKRRKKN